MAKWVVLIITLSVIWSLFVNATIEEDRQALLDFLGNSSHPQSLNWDINTSVCTQWTGILCDSDHTKVVEIHLPGIGFRGPIPRDTLSRLSSLQVLSLRVNRFSGSFPSDFDKLSNLTAIYLKSNNFSGPFPRDFSVWKSLSVVDLSNNDFNGTIPTSLANLTQLSVLNISRNSLSGPVPDLKNPSLVEIDFSNNSLSGTVPRSMLRFPSSAFVGNELAKEITPAVPPSFPVQPPIPQALPVKKTRKKSKLTEPILLAVAIGGSVLVFVMIVMLFLILRSKSSKNNNVAKSDKSISTKAKKKKMISSNNEVSGESQEKTNRLFFFEGCSLAFDLEDLLRASAEVLGKGTFGTTYKAALEDAAATLVVKRLKEVTVPRRDFETQMEIVGGIRHENVVPLRAYFYSKDEKLIVFDFYEQGNVSAMLHGGRGPGRVPLDWDTRVKIAVGTARGIAHIHTCNSGRLVHGNVKAANIFLNPQGYGCVSDVGLAALMNPTPAPVPRAAGYRAPEVSDTRKATAASDVYSFGVLLLELLTGKSPVHATGTEEVVHLVRWVNSVVREEWTAEVFDVELLRYANIEEEMVEMLQLGMSCVLKVPEKRPSIVAVLKSLEEIRQINTGTRPSSEVSTPIPTPDVVTEIVGSSSSSSVPK